VRTLDSVRQEIVKTGKQLYNQGFVPGTSGNVSFRHEDQIFLTPSGMNLGDIEPNDVVVLDMNGTTIDGIKIPSSEKAMHLEIYKTRPDVNSIIHAHSPKATAFAAAGIPLNRPVLAEAMVLLGQVPVAEYAMPSSDKLASIVASYFINHDAVLMANHGVVVVGKGLKETYYKLETLELYAEITMSAKLLGNMNELSEEQVQELLELRKNMIK
jgi:L-fuculose-phosphate aldolase